MERENLRDHMTDLELIFTMLGEAASTEITRNRDAQGFDQNKTAAREGGTIAGNARRQLEAKSGRKVVTSQNYLPEKPLPELPPDPETSHASQESYYAFNEVRGSTARGGIPFDLMSEIQQDKPFSAPGTSPVNRRTLASSTEARVPDLDTREADEILGYDETGAFRSRR